MKSSPPTVGQGVGSAGSVVLGLLVAAGAEVACFVVRVAADVVVAADGVDVAELVAGGAADGWPSSGAVVAPASEASTAGSVEVVAQPVMATRAAMAQHRRLVDTVPSKQS